MINMKIKEFAIAKIKSTEIGTRLVEDKRYRIVTTAVYSLIFNIVFAFYNGILGIISESLIFAASSVYYLLLGGMRFFAVLSEKRNTPKKEEQTAFITGLLLIILSIMFHIIVFISMSQHTAAQYGTITMITIATFTFIKITVAIINAIKYRKHSSKLVKAINAIRYSEVAVSLLTMQQSMLVSFGETDTVFITIVNACTGAVVCFFILFLGIITYNSSRKEK